MCHHEAQAASAVTSPLASNAAAHTSGPHFKTDHAQYDLCDGCASIWSVPSESRTLPITLAATTGKSAMRHSGSIDRGVGQWVVGFLLAPIGLAIRHWG